jgi:predicted enzyme related to lactoylglutathione lyase
MPIEGAWAGRVTGVRGQRVEIAMMRTPDAFTVEDIHDTVARLSKLGATVVDEVVDYEGIYRLCYIRSPEGILIGLAQQLGQQAPRENPMERER